MARGDERVVAAANVLPLPDHAGQRGTEPKLALVPAYDQESVRVHLEIGGGIEPVEKQLGVRV